MLHTWSDHALMRLKERSTLSREQVEKYLLERRCVHRRRSEQEEHHLIWDEGRSALIGVPVILPDGVIPTILPVNYGSGYTEYQRADAEYAWLRESYWRDEENGNPAEPLCHVEIKLMNWWIKRSGWPGERELFPLLFWSIHTPEAAQYGDEGVVALFRHRDFRLAVKDAIISWQGEFARLFPQEGDTPSISLAKPGAVRRVPIQFFLRTP